MISDKLKEIRESHNLNKREMSKKLGVPYTTYNNYETGQREPGSTFLIKFSQIFGTTIDYIMENTPSETIEEYKKEDATADIFLRLRIDSDFYEAVQKLHNLSPTKLQGVISMLSSFEQD